jgi:hypothetical protein
MRRTILLGIAVGLALSVVPAVADAQSAPQPAAAPAATTAPKAAPKAAPAKTAKTDPWTGTWSGSLAQVGRGKPFAYSLTLAGKTGKSSYPDDHCAGKLTRIGTAGSYAFFTETITDGKLDPTTMKGCLDGSLTLVKDVNGLVMSWTATHGGKAIVAYGTLAPAK